MIKDADIENMQFSKNWIYRESTYEVFFYNEKCELPNKHIEAEILIDLTLGEGGKYFIWFALIEKPEITFLISSSSGITELEELETDCIKCVFWVPTEEIVVLSIYAPLDKDGYKEWYVGYIYWSIVKFWRENAEKFDVSNFFFQNAAFGDAYIDKDYVIRIHLER